MKLRWRIFFIFSMLYALAYFYRVAMAVLAADIASELKITPSQLGTLSGAFFYSFAFTQIPLGPLLDRYGGKRVVILTGIITIFGVLLFSHASSYPLALSGRILIGAGSASVLMGALRVFTNWFEGREFARISGFIIAVGNVGNLAATAPLAIASTYIHWSSIFLIIACIQAVLLIIAQRLVEEHPPGFERKLPPHDSPQQSGLREILTTPTYWLISFSAFSWYACYMSIQGLWGGPYLMEVVGLSKSGAGQVLLTTSLGFLAGCLLVGHVTEKLTGSPKLTMIIGQIFLAIIMSLFIGPMAHIPSQFLQPVFFLLGLAVSLGVAVYPLVRESFPHRITGTALTSVNFFILFGAASVQQIMGKIISDFPKTAIGTSPTDAYSRAFILPLALLSISTVLFLWARDPRR